MDNSLASSTYIKLVLLNATLSYTGVLALITSISKQHKVPIQKWIDDGASFKFVGDHVDRKTLGA